jgi:hypothetical protein
MTTALRLPREGGWGLKLLLLKLNQNQGQDEAMLML